MPAPQSARPVGRRPLHNHETGALQMLDKPFRNDPRHQLAGVALPLAAVEAQRERQGVGEIIGGGGREAIGRI